MRDDGGEVIDLPQARPKLGLHPSVVSGMLPDGCQPEPELTAEFRESMAKMEARGDGQTRSPQ
jgi:hypothetical protein